MMDANDPMAEIRASFFVECEELLEALLDGLQDLQNGTDDPETIHVVFRAVHSIKGGGGAFGLEAIVRFAHQFETVLDEIRSGRMAPDTDALNLFLRCTDHLSDLVHACRDAEEIPAMDGQDLTTQLENWLSGKNSDESSNDATDSPKLHHVPLSRQHGETDEAAPTQSDDPQEEPQRYGDYDSSVFHIEFRPETELLESGSEPLLILQALDRLGTAKVTCHAEHLPGLSDLVPEAAYVSWTIALTTNAQAAEIASVFEFVDGLCTVSISQWNAFETTPETNIETSGETLGAAPDPAGENPVGFEKRRAEVTREDPGQEPLKAQETETGSCSLQTPTQKMASGMTPVVRVDLERIDRLVNLVGELVINQAMLSQSLERSGLSPHSDAMNGLEEFQRLTRDIQDSVMMIRAQPVKSLFQRMSRIVREASATVGKDVALTTEGEATEVDKTVIERLADPLTHMIRNAVDHGLETPDERLAAGKPRQGEVRLSAEHRSGRVNIDICDDGGGINRAKVLQTAIEKGLVSPEAALSESEIDNLLFLPGFSTASEVSDLSGRGVGMDVVRTEIQALGGRITISSVQGEGTKFSISLPLTLAVMDGMVVKIAEETVVLPLNVVLETFTLQRSDVQMVRPGANVVRVRDGFVPLFDLGHELGFRAPIKEFEGSAVLLIAHEEGDRTALIIDSIIDQRQVVIKGLDDSLYHTPGIAAATILGDGQIALILDTSDITANGFGTHDHSPHRTLAGLSA